MDLTGGVQYFSPEPVSSAQGATIVFDPWAVLASLGSIDSTDAQNWCAMCSTYMGPAIYIQSQIAGMEYNPFECINADAAVGVGPSNEAAFNLCSALNNYLFAVWAHENGATAPIGVDEDTGVPCSYDGIPPFPAFMTPSSAPCGGNTTTELTLGDMTTAFSEAGIDAQVTWQNTQQVPTPYTPGNLLPIFENLSSGDLVSIATLVNGAYCAAGLIHTEITNDPDEANPTFTTTCNEDGSTLFKINTVAEVSGSAGTDIVTVTTETCDGLAEKSYLVLAQTNDEGTEVTQQQLFQDLFDKIDGLLQCCNPCTCTPQELQTLNPGMNEFTVDNPIAWATIQISQSAYQGWLTLGDDPFGHFGLFKWVWDDGTESRMHFISSENQTIYTHEVNALKVRVYLNPGVSGTLALCTRPAWSVVSPT